ncbi:MAG TPA: PAS domain-containing protein, partial [Acidimicrobiia bacterium]|nr:PAS domain-containing protein [Acidimicrobiia bacterium]
MTESNPSERRQRGSGTILPGGRRGEDPDTQLRPPASPTARVARYRLIVEELDDVVSRHNRAGRFLDVSESATAIFGRSPAQLLSCTWRDVIHPDDTLPFEEWWRSVHGGSPGSLGFRILRPDRSVVWVETSAAAGVLLEEGVFEVQAVTRDISTRVEQLESAVRRARELEE